MAEAQARKAPTFGEFTTTEKYILRSRTVCEISAVMSAGFTGIAAVSVINDYIDYGQIFLAFAAALTVGSAALYFGLNRFSAKVNEKLNSLSEGKQISGWLYWAARSYFATPRDTILDKLDALLGSKFSYISRRDNHICKYNTSEIVEANAHSLNGGTCIDIIIVSMFGKQNAIKKGNDLLSKLSGFQ